MNEENGDSGDGYSAYYGDSSDARRHGATSPSRKMRRHFPTDRPGLLPSDEHAEEPGGIRISRSGGDITGDRASARFHLADTTPRRASSSSSSTLPCNFGAISTRLSRISLVKTTLRADRRIATNTTATAQWFQNEALLPESRRKHT